MNQSTEGEMRKGASPIKDLPSVEFLERILIYNPETGKFFWKAREEWPSHCNTKYAGKEAGSKRGNGYISIQINGVEYACHRIAYKMHYGIEPPPMIDHINTNRSDNKINNLRPISRSENHKNSVVQINNKSGCKGVGFCKTRQLWYVRSPQVNGTKLHKGYYPSKEKAISVRVGLYGEYACFGPRAALKGGSDG